MTTTTPNALQSVSPNDADASRFDPLPTSNTTHLVGFDDATVINLLTFPPRYVLRVQGENPIANMKISLVPAVHHHLPEYWKIEVVGQLPTGVELPLVVPYDVSLPLAGTIGTRGIEVVGADQTKKIDIAMSGTSHGWTARVDNGRLRVEGTLTLPTPGWAVQLREHEPQGFNPRNLLLDEVVTPPTSIEPDHVVTENVSYEQPAEPGEFDSVTLLPHGPTIPIVG